MKWAKTTFRYIIFMGKKWNPSPEATHTYNQNQYFLKEG